MTGPPSSLPRPALWLGVAGLLPFLGGALAALLGDATIRPFALAALAAYGAVILSFLGAVHWGLALRAGGTGAEAGAAGARLGLGVLPALVAWVALLLPAGGSLGLALLALGILGTAAAETLAARWGLVPKGYLRLRWGLSLGAAACLLAGSVGA